MANLIFITARDYDFIYFCVQFGIDIYRPKQFTRATITINELKREISKAIDVIVIGICQRIHTAKLLFVKNLVINTFAVCVSSCISKPKALTMLRISQFLFQILLMYKHHK